LQAEASLHEPDQFRPGLRRLKICTSERWWAAILRTFEFFSEEKQMRLSVWSFLARLWAFA